MSLTRRLFFVVLFSVSWLSAADARAATFLFDATKAETAGNADWVIDEDNSVPGRFPTPAQSGITASTTESYWTGALSAWGVALVQLGQAVETLPSGGRITFQDGSNAQDLSNYKVFVVCEPNILFTAAEKTAIVRFVQNGGGLFIISDHAGSDRNNDGADSVAVWNDLFTNNGVQANPFGVAINSNDISLTSSAVDASASDPLTNGPIGAVSQLKFSDGATLTLDTSRNASVQAAFWSSTTHTNSNVMAAYGTFGAGRFAVVGDSSPSDDGTGAPGNTLYAGWTELGVNHSRLYLNASVWLQGGGGNSTAPPANDNFAQATALSSAATSAAGSNVNATKETGEPAHAGKAGGASVWWQFTAAASGTAVISTTGSNFDTLLAVYTGTAVNALSAVASNDNDGALSTSRVSFAVVAGTTYRVAVDGVSGATGGIVLALSLPQPPTPLTNDNFVNAYTLTGPVASDTSNNAAATKETGEPNHAANSGGHSLWWTWTAPASGAATVSTVGSNFDTILGIYTGTAVNALTTIASDDDSGGSLTSKATFTAVAGTVYRMAVDGYNGKTGNIALSVSGQTPPSVGIAATTSVAAEKGQTPGVFTLTLSAAPSVSTTVRVQLTGTAALNADYAVSPTAASDGTVLVTFPAGQTSATLTITPVDDNDPTEGDESVTATLLADAGYTVNGSSATASVTIRDNSAYTSAWSAAYRAMGFSGANAAAMADPDGDGVPNLLEFAFNLNPLVSDAAGLPSIGTAAFVDPNEGTGTMRRFLTVTLVRRTDAPNLTYVVEACDDLAAGNWASAGAVFVSASASGMPAGTEQAVYRTARPLDGPNAVAKQYLRVRVSAAQ